MAVAATQSILYAFSSLPLELRDQIWREAMPSKIGPALHFYRTGKEYWRPRRRLQSEEGYYHENEGLNLIFEFRYDLLDDVQFEVPLLFVNREARHIALPWVREQRLQMRRREGRRYPVFVRPFELTRDALYVAPDNWIDLLMEPHDRAFQPDLVNRIMDVETAVTRIALPEAVIHTQLTTLSEVFDYFHSVRVLLIVVNAELDVQPADDDMKVQRRWEFDSVRGGAFFWNSERRRLEYSGGDFIGGEALYALINGELNEELTKALRYGNISGLEIRPVFAVRR